MKKLCNCESDNEKACANCGKYAPDYASEVPFVPMNWTDRDNITGRLMEILEAVMPEGRQLTATKNLVKECTKWYWINAFNNQFDSITGNDENPSAEAAPYSTAVWNHYVENGMSKDE